MPEQNSRERILQKIKTALQKSTPLPFPEVNTDTSVFQPLQQDMVVEFAEQFTQLLGKFHFCTGPVELLTSFNILCEQQKWTKLYCVDPALKDFLQQRTWSDDIASCHASITGCEALVARTGSILLSARDSGRVTSVYAPVHVCIAFTSQLLYDIKDALAYVQKKYNGDLPSFLTMATGPSRTADIEKTLVVGVHGPKEVYLLLVDDLTEAS
jgi:L-lactate dehydrogenase complex protein LldG